MSTIQAADTPDGAVALEASSPPVTGPSGTASLVQRGETPATNSKTLSSSKSERWVFLLTYYTHSDKT